MDLDIVHNFVPFQQDGFHNLSTFSTCIRVVAVRIYRNIIMISALVFRWLTISLNGTTLIAYVFRCFCWPADARMRLLIFFMVQGNVLFFRYLFLSFLIWGRSPQLRFDSGDWRSFRTSSTVRTSAIPRRPFYIVVMSPTFGTMHP